MMLLPAGVKVHLALGHTDMRKGIDGLAGLVQEVLKEDSFSGHLFAFRGRNARMIKILFWDGTGLCLFTKRMERACACSPKGWSMAASCGRACIRSARQSPCLRRSLRC